MTNTMDNAFTTKSFPMDSSKLFSATPSLLGLPLELRLQICGYLFHIKARNCDNLGLLGCRCGDNAYLTNSQLFNELRTLHLIYARFVFKDPSACLRFLECIQDDFIHLRDIVITLRTNYSDTTVLGDICSKLEGKNLRGLQLEIKKENGINVSLDLNPPVYSTLALEKPPDLAYYLALRPSRHPLGDLKFLRPFTVIGHPGTGEIGAAIFKLTRTNWHACARRRTQEARQQLGYP